MVLCGRPFLQEQLSRRSSRSGFLLMVTSHRSDDHISSPNVICANISPIRTRILNSEPAILTTKPLAVADATAMFADSQVLEIHTTSAKFHGKIEQR